MLIAGLFIREKHDRFMNDPYFSSFPHWINNGVKGNRFVDNIRHYLKSCPLSTWEVGYFYVSAFIALKSNIDHLSELRVMIGMGTDEKTATMIERSMDEIEERIFTELNSDLDVLDFDADGNHFDYIYECLVREKIKVHVLKKPSHKKIYWLDQFDKIHDIVMHGSANFSVSGLGIVYQGNNLQIDSSKTADTTVKHYKEELEMDWNDSVPFNRKLVDVIKRHPRVRKHRGKGGKGGKPATDPDGLIHLKPPDFFKHVINKHRLFHLFDQGKFELKSFQLVDYLSCQECIQNAGGVLLADEAGLGKTVISCRIIQDYYKEGKRFLIMVPPGTSMKQWLHHLKMFGIGFENGSKIISEGIIPYESFTGQDWRGFDLVVIDEAHHYRNVSTSRFNNFMSNFKAVNPSCDVLLITATPMNNSPVDLVNLLKMIENPGKFRSVAGDDFDRFKIIARKKVLTPGEKESLNEISDQIQGKLMVRTTTRDLRESGETFEIAPGIKANFQEITPVKLEYSFTGPEYTSVFFHRSST
jgi:hypothetical protein